jgi:hypothetical protein
MDHPELWFERTIVKLQAEDGAWHVWLNCGHEVCMMTWPWAPKLMCAQCVNEYVEKQKLGRCPTCGSPSPQLHPAMQVRRGSSTVPRFMAYGQNIVKIIETEWQDYRRKVIPLHASEIQLQESRRAFFAGAWAYYALVMHRLDPGAEPTDADMKFMEDLDREMREFEDLDREMREFEDLDREMREFAQRVKRGEA